MDLWHSRSVILRTRKYKTRKFKIIYIILKFPTHSDFLICKIKEHEFKTKHFGGTVVISVRSQLRMFCKQTADPKSKQKHWYHSTRCAIIPNPRLLTRRNWCTCWILYFHIKKQCHSFVCFFANYSEIQNLIKIQLQLFDYPKITTRVNRK